MHFSFLLLLFHLLTILQNYRTEMKRNLTLSKPRTTNLQGSTDPERLKAQISDLRFKFQFENYFFNYQGKMTDEIFIHNLNGLTG